MRGLLIDTLVYNFFQDNGNFSDCDTNDYLKILIRIIDLLSEAISGYLIQVMVLLF
jgi:hypothetical protein